MPKSEKERLKNRSNQRGVALLMVLTTILVVVILANIILNMALSQTRFTRHQISRVQAYYAAQAGINIALENLRNGTWVAGVNCLAANPCPVVFPAGSFNPASVAANGGVQIVITPGTGIAGTATVSATTTYTYAE